MEQHPYIFQPIVVDNPIPNSYYQWGQHYEKQGENEKAVERYQLAHTQNNVNATYKLAEYNLARNRLRAGNLKKTIKYLETASEKGIVYAIFNLAILFTNKQDLSHAHAVVDRYSNHSLDGFMQNIDEKHHGIVHYFLGVNHEYCGCSDDAMEHYIKSYKLGFKQGMQKLMQFVKNERKLLEILKRENIPITNDNPLFPTFKRIECVEKYQKHCQCQACEKYALCMPFGYLRLCEPCEKSASKTQTDLLFDCYKECCDKYELYRFIEKYGGTVEKSFGQIITVSNTNNYCNEIVYAGNRTNNALYAQIIKIGCETYTQQLKTKAVLQMLSCIAKDYTNNNRLNRATEIYEIIVTNHTAIGKIAYNIGWIQEQHNMFNESLKYYLLAYETGISCASHDIIYSYVGLNDMTNALKYSIKSIHDGNACSLSWLKRLCDGDEIIDTVLFGYFENGQIFLLNDIKKYVDDDYRFYKILSRVTNPHRVVKVELNKLSAYESCVTDDCPICFDEKMLLIPLKCGHAFCYCCVKQINGKCPYRCKTVL